MHMTALHQVGMLQPCTQSICSGGSIVASAGMSSSPVPERAPSGVHSLALGCKSRICSRQVAVLCCCPCDGGCCAWGGRALGEPVCPVRSVCPVTIWLVPVLRLVFCLPAG